MTDLKSYNRAAAGPENMQIRVALHEGPVSVDDMGVSGQTVIHCARLLDAAVFRSAMYASGSAVGVIASELVHDLAVSQGACMPDPASVQHVGIRAKELETTAWMWFFWQRDSTGSEAKCSESRSCACGENP